MVQSSVLMRAHGARPHGALVMPDIQPKPTKIVRFGQSSFSTFRVVEMDIVRPSPNSMQFLYGHGASAHGAPMAPGFRLETYDTLNFSDAGFSAADGTPYPPYVTSAFDLNRAMTLTADALGGALSAGAITLVNIGGGLNAMLAVNVNDHLPVRISAGQKLWDATRGIWRDPAYDSLIPVFAGLGKSWKPDRTSIQIDLLDATYWLTGAMPIGSYGGTGGLDGDSNVAGRSIPRLRGRAHNITPVLIDSINYVYHVSDGPGSILALYEGGFAGGIAYAGDVEDLYAVTPKPGTYVVQTDRGGTWFRLGTKPVYAITVDAEGKFRSGAAPANVLDILRQFLLEDMLLPTAYIDPAWEETSAMAPWPGGWFWDGSASVTGKNAVTALLSGLGITLIPTRTGTLLPIRLVAPSASSNIVAEITPDVIIALSGDDLDGSLDPPTWRWRIGFAHNFTVQAAGSSLHPQITAAQQSFVAQQDRAAIWYSAEVKSRWRVPNDPDTISTALTRQDDAALIAQRHGALWGTKRKIWAVSIPQIYAWQIDLGDVVAITAPAPGLEQRAVGVVVGEAVQASSQTVTLQILV
ncbi:hypothetical protein [Acetobacter fabarum]|uniref:hypothetical protein n=1 Tax=Acetobacter fabarum TaxID=483199 RepID=UPI003908D014|nr:hypothetical protein [Acetobacter fabarum]MCI1927848.1 hypothetical protein [Acetobacter fabarum]MCI1947865.1 hypothetical protein [Acetobacter fabarum]MCI1988856.1 hypothetical protein [Acetobacter fabarum]MCI2024302.1 hypothetical protein [Acetobacter fabarum]